MQAKVNYTLRETLNYMHQLLVMILEDKAAFTAFCLAFEGDLSVRDIRVRTWIVEMRAHRDCLEEFIAALQESNVDANL